MDQTRPIPKSPPVDFERLFVQGQEVLPSGGSAQIPAIKPISTKGEVDVKAVVNTLNLLIYELKAAGLMADK